MAETTARRDHELGWLSVDERRETVALFALLRSASKNVTWADIANEVRFAGSALQVVEEAGDSQSALLPDPNMEAAMEEADAALAEWERAGLDLVTVLSERYPRQLAGVFDCPPFLFAAGAVDQILADGGDEVLSRLGLAPWWRRRAPRTP